MRESEIRLYKQQSRNRPQILVPVLFMTISHMRTPYGLFSFKGQIFKRIKSHIYYVCIQMLIWYYKKHK